MSYQKELRIVADIARKAGDLALKYHQQNLAVEIKADESPVTIADKACEKLIVSELTREFPEDGLLGEEGAMSESASGRRWLIDPIDGTRDFIRNTRAWTILIGLEEQGKVVAGSEIFSSHREMFRRRQRRRRVVERPAHACIVGDVPQRSHALLQRAELPLQVSFCARFTSPGFRSSGRFGVRAGCFRRHDGEPTGRAEAWIEPQAQPWDLAPLKIIAEEAGCVTFDFAGNDTIYGGNFVITVPALADEIREFVGRK